MAFSPHTRGWSGSKAVRIVRPQRSPRTRGDGPTKRGSSTVYIVVLPAHAGMVRAIGWFLSYPSRSPRTRGDGPYRGQLEIKGLVVLPAHAGMVRPMPLPPQAPDKFSPHTRGWSSRVPAQRPVQIRSPRTRGDGPDVVSQGLMVKWVLPAHAGMVR